MRDYADAYILIDGTIRAESRPIPGEPVNANTRLALKNCAPFTKCNLEINDEHVEFRYSNAYVQFNRIFR